MFNIITQLQGLAQKYLNHKLMISNDTVVPSMYYGKIIHRTLAELKSSR